MNKVAIVFPGQGSQYAGMGKDFYDNFKESKDIFDRANKALGFDIKKLCFEGPEEDLSITKITQPALLTTSIAMYKAVEEKISGYEIVMGGLSLGEYTALTAAGAMDFETAVNLVHKRGNYMQSAVPIGKGGMLALIGCNEDDVVRFCRDVSDEYGILEPANFNCPSQIVVGGDADAIEKASSIISKYNIKRAIKLQVSAPFHTSMLKSAGDRLREDLQQIKYNAPVHSVISNVDEKYYSGIDEIASKLEKQVYNTVRWEGCVKKMINDGVTTFVEIGPGKTLTSFIKKIDKGINVINIEKIQDLESLANI